MGWNELQESNPQFKVKDVNDANTPHVYRNYKDRVFRLLFNNKTRLLELYNALNGSDYTNEEELIINTLENAVYMKMKNDVSFIVESNMCLYEHQSSFCPNMPLRGFFYFSDLYKKLLKDVDLSVGKRIKIPAPKYIVFYNGQERDEEEFIQKLSESFEDDKEGCLELTVQTININRGHNGSLLKKSPTLYGYAYFVSLVRKNMESMELKEAVERAVDECIREDILRDFLLEQKAEVVAMSIYEYNEEYAKKANFEAGEEAGYAKGEEAGYAKGEEAGYVRGEEAGYVRGRDEGQERVNRLIRMLLEQNRINDITRATSDKAYQKKLFEELGIDVN